MTSTTRHAARKLRRSGRTGLVVGQDIGLQSAAVLLEAELATRKRPHRGKPLVGQRIYPTQDLTANAARYG